MDNKKKKKPIYKRIWFWIVIIAAIGLAVVNIVFACAFEGEQSNLFTAISGWVSGIATAVLGFVAVLQNERYENDNKEFLKEQQVLQEQIVRENIRQNDFALRLAEYNKLCEFQQSVRNELLSFFSKDIATELNTIICDCYERFEKDNIFSINEIGQFVGNQQLKIMALSIRIRLFPLSFKYRNELLFKLHEFAVLMQAFNKYKRHAAEWEYLKNELSDDLNIISGKYIGILIASNNYLDEIQEALDYIYDRSVSYEEYEEYISELKDKKAKDEKEYFKTVKESEDKDGQAENGD